VLSRVLSSLLMVFLLAGCFALPSKKLEKKEQKMEAAETKLSGNEIKQLEVGRDYLYSADYTLSLIPNPSRYDEVAKSLTERGLLATGLPPAEEAFRLQKMTRNLVSTNVESVKEGEKQLAQKDKEIVKLQDENVKLQAEVVKTKQDYMDVATKAAADADFKAKIMRWVRFIVWSIIIAIIIHIASVLVPPPYNAPLQVVAMLLGAIGRGIFKAAPAAAVYAGSVSKQVYQTSENTLVNLVHSIQDIKEKKPEVFSELEPILKAQLDTSDKIKVQEVKRIIRKL
jgi:hypothetical protein